MFIVSNAIFCLLLWKKCRPRPPGRAPNPPSWGHSAQAQLLLGRPYVVGCRPDFWSSIFLEFFFKRIFVPKAQEKHFMMSRNDFFHELGGPQHGKNAKNACFLAKNNIQNGVGGVCVHEKIYFGNWISSLFGGPICQILSFGAPHGDQQTHFAKKRYL